MGSHLVNYNSGGGNCLKSRDQESSQAIKVPKQAELNLILVMGVQFSSHISDHPIKGGHFIGDSTPTETRVKVRSSGQGKILELVKQSR